MAIDINNLNSVDGIKRELQPYISGSGFEKSSIIESSDFNWLAEIVSTSLDDYAKEYLIKNKPEITNYVLLDLSDHFSEVSAIINQNIARRNELFELETQALLKGIEYVQNLNSIDAEKKISNLNLVATFKQSGFEHIKEYEVALQSKFDIFTASLKTKLSFHNQKGHPLNYGERIKYLRDIYYDNIKKIYERLVAIKRTLLYSFNAETLAIPNIIDNCNNLDELVK